jgi:hypothetical protein
MDQKFGMLLCWYNSIPKGNLGHKSNTITHSIVITHKMNQLGKNEHHNGTGQLISKKKGTGQ